MSDPKSAYEAWHDQLPIDAAANTPWHRMIREAIAGRDFSHKHVLEIGCGRGGFSCWFARTWPNSTLTAADFAETAITKGKAYAQSEKLFNIAWRVADIQSMPWSDGQFDVVVSCETIEHVPDPRTALGELARVLRPGGLLYLTFPNYFSLAGLHRIYRRVLRGEQFREEGQPINQFTMIPQVRRWVQLRGLQVLKVRSVNHSLPFPRRPGITLPWLDGAPFPFTWIGNNSLICARKPTD